MFIVGDIGGTNMRVAAATDSLGGIRKVPTPKDPGEGIATFVELARACAGTATIEAVAVCVAGTVSEAGVLSGARNLRAWEGTNLVEELSQALQVPTRVLNDAAIAGLGEAYAGAGKGVSTLVYVTVSTGVGGGWIVGGKIAAADGIADIKIKGVDLENLVSGTAVTKKFGIPAKDLDSLEERNLLADLLAEGLQTVLLRWPSELIVLGGSMIVGVNPIPLSRVQASLATLLPKGEKPPVIKMAELGDSGGLWGDLALLRQRG